MLIVASKQNNVLCEERRNEGTKERRNEGTKERRRKEVVHNTYYVIVVSHHHRPFNQVQVVSSFPLL